MPHKLRCHPVSKGGSFMKPPGFFLILGSIASLLLALLHLVLVFRPQAWRYFGADALSALAKQGSAGPHRSHSAFRCCLPPYGAYMRFPAQVSSARCRCCKLCSLSLALPISCAASPSHSTLSRPSEVSSLSTLPSFRPGHS